MKIILVPSLNNIGKYLGCHNIDRKRTKGDFTKIKDRISSKLAGWKAGVLL